MEKTFLKMKCVVLWLFHSCGFVAPELNNDFSTKGFVSLLISCSLFAERLDFIVSGLGHNRAKN